MNAGIPGSYSQLEREWRSGDQVSLNLAMGFRMKRYEGYDQVPGHSRYSLEYGPLLLGLAGKPNFEGTVRILNDPSQPGEWLIPVEGKPLHYHVAIERGYWGLREDEAWSSKAFEYMPYFDIPMGQEFTAFPVVQYRSGN